MIGLTSSDQPFRVDVFRGPALESVHAVDLAVCDSDGTIVLSLGDHQRQIFPRSSNKALQALPLVESGAADAYGFSNADIALACASHSGEPMHVETATGMLAKAGQTIACLECGAHVPFYTGDFKKLFHGNPTAAHNNCSGKHAGFVAFASHAGFDPAGYVSFDHPVQREVASVLEAVTKVPHGNDNYGIDGCSIPTWHLPMDRLATTFAKFATGADLPASRAKAMARIMEACFEHPEMVAGTDRMCTRIMRLLPGKAFVKVGAEGVYTASLPELGLGVALKARCGTTRAAEVAICSVLEMLLELDEKTRAALIELRDPVLKNWNGIEVGSLAHTR